MSSALLVNCDQKIPKTFKQGKNIIRWHNLGGISEEDNLASTVEAIETATDPGPFWGSCPSLGEPA